MTENAGQSEVTEVEMQNRRPEDTVVM